MKLLPRIYYCLQGKEPISSDAGIEKKKEKKTEKKNYSYPMLRIELTVGTPCTANVALVTTS